MTLEAQRAEMYSEWQRVLKKYIAILDVDRQRSPSPIDWGVHLRTRYGSLILRQRPNRELWMVSVKIRRAYRGQGLSKKLLKHSLRLSKVLGHSKIYLDCKPELSKVYEAVGFTTVGPSRYIDGYITMLKDLK